MALKHEHVTKARTQGEKRAAKAALKAAEQRFFMRLILGDSPDVAARTCGLANEQAGRAMRDRWERHIRAVASIGAATYEQAKAQWSIVCRAHGPRITDLIQVAEIADLRATLSPDAPSPHRMAKGGMARGRAKAENREATGAEVVRYVNRACTPLKSAQEAGKLSPAMVTAGERLEALAVKSGISVNGGRSCLDMTPRGTESEQSESAVEAIRKAKQEVTEALEAMPMECRNVVVNVCVYGEATGDRRMKARRWRLLVKGLECLVRKWGLETV